ncbi:MAG: CPBP family intramembrane metalloprotease [Bacteroidetes bacterium]|nr:MAG: CPBP family intramembrane metalloprotease [Bacteroidota bacterium]
MGDTRSHIPLYERSPLYQLIFSLLIVSGVGFILFSAFLFAGTYIYNSKIELLENPSLAINGNEIAFLRYVLIFQHISLFVIPAIILLSKFKPVQRTGFRDMKIPPIKEMGLVIILAFCIFPITNFAGQLNSGMHLPDWLSGVERWMIKKEESATSLFDAIMTPSGFGSMIMNLLMIAALPAIGEELIFRGIFQKILYKLFNSGNLAVWITAFIFSFLHFQFFGFVPRFILGLVFGYLFYWSRTLWLPIIAHFVNNAVPVIEVYIQGWDNYKGFHDIPLWKLINGLPIPLLISILIFSYFRNKSKRIAKAGTDNFQLTDT